MMNTDVVNYLLSLQWAKDRNRKLAQGCLTFPLPEQRGGVYATLGSLLSGVQSERQEKLSRGPHVRHVAQNLFFSRIASDSLQDGR